MRKPYMTVTGLAVAAALLAGIACTAPAAGQPSGTPTTVVIPTTVVSPTPTEEAEQAGNLDALLAQVKHDLSIRFGVGPESVVLDSATDMQWPDASLGNPKQGQSYAQVITPGYKLVLGVGEDTYVYHTSMDRVEFVSKIGGPDAALTDSDKATIVRLALEWAIVGQNVPDFAIIDAENIVLSLENIDAILTSKLPGVNFITLSPEEIQARANENGDFVYLRMGEIRMDGGFIEASIETRMAVAEDSEVMYLIGGGCILRFEQADGRWALAEQPGMCWIS